MSANVTPASTVRVSCLSVRQPYASAIIAGVKLEEYRSKPTKHRGLLAIHAATKVEYERFSKFPGLNADDCPTGAIIGLVELVECLYDNLEETYVWILEKPRMFKEPIPMKGRLGLFPVEIPADLLG